MAPPTVNFPNRRWVGLSYKNITSAAIPLRMPAKTKGGQGITLTMNPPVLQIIPVRRRSPIAEDRFKQDLG